MAQIIFIRSINCLHLLRYFVENILGALIFALTCSTIHKVINGEDTVISKYEVDENDNAYWKGLR